ncbi:hypothetical protein CC78DRAFT_599703 [Lojkania enalia]|uniref:Uncharacterized protein n=1 Tax=Lojkania enalia TaxID=147567 RepID=A0A9P4NBV1_9PLEO|nr:hypothetical protein CC78DRAFT_599703 [Didymosphaeria enalia]
MKSFRVLKEKATDIKFVFIIDSMDGFQGGKTGLIELVTHLASSGVKLCASSRPWNVSQDSLGHHPHLRLEHLTFNDIGNDITSSSQASMITKSLNESIRNLQLT